MMAEISALTQALEAPQRPAVALVGGAKVSSKIDVLFNLIGKLDTVIVGGGMANTFLAANGLPIGKSPHESAKFETVRKILSRAQSCGCQIVLPVDIVWADRFERGAEKRRSADGGDRIAVEIAGNIYRLRAATVARHRRLSFGKRIEPVSAL